MVDRAAPNSGLANLMNLQGVGVNPASQLAYVPSKDLMTRYQTISNPRTGIPQVVGTTGMAEGGNVRSAAEQVASYGRNGDTTLVHMTPKEVQGLASLGKLTVNPETGLPEAFNLKSILPIAAGIAGSMFLGPAIAPALGLSASGAAAAGIGAGLGTFGGSLLAGQKPGEALFNSVLSGAMSWGIGSALGTGADAVKGASSAAQVEADIASGIIGPAGDVGAGVVGPTGVPTVGQTMQPAMMYDPTLAMQQPPAMMYDSILAMEQPYSLYDPNISSTKVMLDPIAAPFEAPQTLPDVTKYAVSPSKLSSKLFGSQPITVGEEGLTEAIIKTKASDPLSYAPLAAGALTGAFDEPYKYEEPAPRPKPETGYGTKRLVGGELITPPKTAAQIQEEMLYGGYTPRFTPYRYAASGGLIGLQAGGMPTVQQQPSAMQSALGGSGLQAMQQPVMMQPQPQQQMMAPVPQQTQPPAFDPTSQFMKMMDMQEQVDQQKAMGQLQGQSAILGLIGAATSQGNQQGVYNQPNGQMPQLPKALPTNYGSQVNLGLAEGGRPTYEQFSSTIQKKDPLVGFVLNLPFIKDQLSSQGVETGMFRASPSTANMGGAASMQQLLNRPTNYGSQVNLGLNEGGMPSREYFEGRVEGNGDGMSDGVEFEVDSEEIDGAMLSPDEYVLPADVVAMIGNGSSDAGADKLDMFVKQVRKESYGTEKQQKPYDDRGLAALVA